MVAAATKAGMPEPFARELVAELTSLAFWQEAGASEHLIALITEQLTCNVASYEGVDTATIMEYGTGAGNPIADILFVLAYAMIIKSLRK